MVRVLTTFGDLGGAGRPDPRRGGPPDLPPVEECLQGRGELPDGRGGAIADRFETAVDPDTLGWVRGRADRRGAGRRPGCVWRTAASRTRWR